VQQGQADMGDNAALARRPDPDRIPTAMPTAKETKHRTDLLNRLKRAEGQLRGVQRMIEEGQPCLDIASQISAVRKALDSAYVRMTVCYMEQEFETRLGSSPEALRQLGEVMSDVQTLLGKVR
jgi:DNA-binding FrmR family transcriptional regulator